MYSSPLLKRLLSRSRVRVFRNETDEIFHKSLEILGLSVPKQAGDAPLSAKDILHLGLQDVRGGDYDSGHGALLEPLTFPRFCQEVLDKGKTPLHLACEMGDLKMVKTLCFDCYLNVKDHFGDSPLHIAACFGYSEICEYLVDERKCSLALVNEEMMSALHLACKSNHYDSVSVLVKSKKLFKSTENIMAQDKFGNTPLHYACRHSGGGSEIASLLVAQMPADVMLIKNKDGKSPAHDAFESRNVDFLTLVSHSNQRFFARCHVDTKFSLYTYAQAHLEEWKCLVHAACMRGDKKLISYFLKDEIMFNCYYSNEVGQLPVVTWMLHCVKDFRALEEWYSTVSQYKKYPFHYLASIMHSMTQWELLDTDETSAQDIETLSFYLNHTDDAGNLPLHILCKYDRKYKYGMRFLRFFAQCHVNTKNLQGKTPLDEAYGSNHFSTCAWLMCVKECDIYLNMNMKDTERCKAVQILSEHAFSDLPFSAIKPSRVVPGDTLLHAAASAEYTTAVIQYLIHVKKFDIHKTNSRQEYALHIACKSGCSTEAVQQLRECNVVHQNVDGDTPLDLVRTHHPHRYDLMVCLMGSKSFSSNVQSEACLELVIAEWLSKYDIPELLVLHNNINNPLHIALKFGDISLVEILKQDYPEDFITFTSARNVFNELPLHLAARTQDVKMVRLVSGTCNPNALTNKRNTALHEVCLYSTNSEKDLEIVMFLCEELGCNPHLSNARRETALHLTCRQGSLKLVEYLLKKAKCDPNVEDSGNCTPLMLTPLTQHDIIRVLIESGADSCHLYNAYKEFFKTYSCENPPPTPLNVIVLGKPSSGKSTLIKALESDSSLEIVQAETLTAGIIPSSYQSESLGNVAWYDLAGQSEYYASHEAVLHTILSSSSPLVLLLVDIRKTQETIQQDILYWLHFLQSHTQPKLATIKPHIAMVFSFADKLPSGCAEERIKFATKSLIPFFNRSGFLFVHFIPLDCRMPDSCQIRLLRSQIKSSYSNLRDNFPMDFLLHCFYAFLLGNFQHTPAVMVKDVLVLSEEWITSGIDPHFAPEEDENASSAGSIGSDEVYDPEFEPDFEEESPARLLPEEHKQLLKYCEKLNSKGHIMIVRDSSKTENSWLVINKEILLKEVNGSLFAPSHFRQHYKNLSTNTGVVASSTIAEMFPQYDIVMLTGFLTHLEFCQEISDEGVLLLMSSESKCSGSDRYFFFPGLVSVEKPGNVWNSSQESFNKCGWILQTTDASSFFTPRFIQVLLLRIAFYYSLAVRCRHIGFPCLTLSRLCSVWKNGIFWKTEMGLECLVEITEDCQAVVLMTHCTSNELSNSDLTSYARYRSSLIMRILSAVEELCPSLDILESFCLPDHVQYPPMKCEEMSLFSVRCIARAECFKRPFVLSSQPEYDNVELDKLIQFEPFLASDIRCLFDASMQDKQISNDDLLQFANAATSGHHSVNYYSMFTTEIGMLPSLHEVSTKTMFEALCHWRDSGNHTYGDLCTYLGQYSIFGNRDPQVLGDCTACQVLPSSNIHDMADAAEITSLRGGPTLPAMISFKCYNGSRINFLERIGCHYSAFGILLLKDDYGAKVSAIEHKHMHDPPHIITEILQLWVQGTGLPLSWETLVDVLHNVGLEVLAEHIKTTIILAA